MMLNREEGGRPGPAGHLHTGSSKAVSRLTKMARISPYCYTAKPDFVQMLAVLTCVDGSLDRARGVLRGTQ